MADTKHFITISDHTKDQIESLLNLSVKLKHEYASGVNHTHLNKKTLALIFHKPSTRTRVSFETGVYQLGGNTIYLTQSDIVMGSREPVIDISRVLSRYVNAVVIRTINHNDIVQLAKYSSVPIINGLSSLSHPCQALADALTIREKFGRLNGIKVAYIGDGNNVCTSLFNCLSLFGAELVISCPEGYDLDPKLTHPGYTTVRDPKDAVKNADVVYTDVWASMGQENEQEKRKRDLQPYQVDSSLMHEAKPGAIFMHCLPAHRGQEVTDEVMESPNSVVFDQAENRMHAQKAILVTLM